MKVLSGILGIIGVIAFLVWVVDNAAEYFRLKKAVKQGNKESVTKSPKGVIVKRVALPLAIVMIGGSVLTGNIETKSRSATNSGAENQITSTSSFKPTKYDDMRDKIIVYLSTHNDTSSVFDTVAVEWSNGKVEFNITLEAYETYTFAAVTSATTDIVRKLVKEYDIEAYRLWVHSPSDAKYTISWISFNLDAGTINDNGYNGKYSDTIRLDAMLKYYGYEDYEGNLSDFLKNQNSLNN